MTIVECGKCHNMFRDEPDTAGVCPSCGHENTWIEDGGYPIDQYATPGTSILCNTCGTWGPGPYRRGKCSRCTGTRIGDLLVCCGDCDQFPCACPGPGPADWDMCVPGWTVNGSIVRVA